MKIFFSLLTKNQREIRSNLLIKVFISLLKKINKKCHLFMKIFFVSADENQQEIRTNFLMKIFMFLLKK